MYSDLVIAKKFYHSLYTNIQEHLEILKKKKMTKFQHTPAVQQAEVFEIRHAVNTDLETT